MKPSDEERIPADLTRVVEQLRERGPEASEFELDEIKLRAMTRARQRSSQGSSFMKTRKTAVSLLLALGLMTSGTAGVIAASGGGNGKGKGKSDAAKSQYKPGKGCGDKNHVHEREGECKKPPR